MSESRNRVAGNDTDGLFARARAGEALAWEELFRTCYPKVVRAVRRRLNPPMRSLYDSTDFASDVWKSLAAKCDRFDFPTVDKLLAFLMRAAEQKVIDEYRRCYTEKRDLGRNRPIDGRLGEPSPGAGLRSMDPTPSQVALAAEGYQRVRSKLTEEKQQALDLKREGYSIEEIANRLDWHPRKVQRFIQDLEEQWPEVGGGR